MRALSDPHFQPSQRVIVITPGYFVRVGRGPLSSIAQGRLFRGYLQTAVVVLCADFSITPGPLCSTGGGSWEDSYVTVAALHTSSIRSNNMYNGSG